MYRVVIVDDERDVRSRLVDMVSKASADFELIAEYENGSDAYEGIISEAPDLVVTDIKIPYIDGIELARRVREAFPLMKIIIITGYDEFDFAKQAANLGVVGFVSKPITLDELRTALEKARDELDDEYLTSTSLTNLGEYYNSTLPLIRENDLYRLSKMSAVTEQFESKLRYNGISIDYRYFAVCSFDFDNVATELDAEKHELILSGMRRLITQCVEGIADTDIFGRYEKLCVLFKSNEPLDLAKIEKAMELVLLRLGRFSDVSISAGVSDIFFDDKNFKRMCTQSLRALEYRGVMGGRRVFTFNSIPVGAASPAVEDSAIRELGYLLRYKSEDEVRAALDDVKKQLQKGDTSGAYYYTLTGVLGALIRACEDPDGLYAVYSGHNDMYRRLFELKTLDEIFAYFKDITSEIKKLNKNVMVGNVEQNLQKVVGYLNSHYADPQLSFESMAGEINFSVSYIGALLKKNLNTTFVKYVTQLRMEHAKELLMNPSLKIIEVSAQLGYADPYYFSHCFKKYTGKSPKEYRENERG